MKENSVDVFLTSDLPFKCHYIIGLEHDAECHDEIEILWLFRGDMTLQCEGKTYAMTEDDVFFIYMHQTHAILSSPDSVALSFRLNKAHLMSRNLFFDPLPFKNRVYTIQELAKKYRQVPLIMSQLIQLLQSKTIDLNTRYQLIGYYNMYLNDLYSSRLKDRYLDVKKKNYDPFLSRFYTINAYVNEHYSQKLTLEQLAALVGISSHRLSHFMKETLGIPFQEYLQNIRFEKALLALKDTKASIQDVVIHCGFSDQKYLNAMMKRRFSLTALQYRKIVQHQTQVLHTELDSPNLLIELKQKLLKILC